MYLIQNSAVRLGASAQLQYIPCAAPRHIVYKPPIL